MYEDELIDIAKELLKFQKNNEIFDKYVSSKDIEKGVDFKTWMSEKLAEISGNLDRVVNQSAELNIDELVSAAKALLHFKFDTEIYDEWADDGDFDSPNYDMWMSEKLVELFKKFEQAIYKFERIR